MKKSILVMITAVLLVNTALIFIGAADQYIQPQNDTAWRNAYRNFVMGKQYESVGMPDYLRDGYQVTGVRGTSYQLTYTGKDDSPIWFALHDMDSDQIPEMIVFNGIDSAGGDRCHVYTCQNGTLRHLGTMGFKSLKFAYSSDQRFPGLVQTDGGHGVYSTYYWFIMNGVPRYEIIQSVKLTGTPEQHTQSIVRESQNDPLYYWYVGTTFTELPHWDAATISSRGWDRFVEEAYYSHARQQAYTATQPPVVTRAPVVTWAPAPTAAPTQAPEIYGRALGDISTRSGPSSSYKDMGTYNVRGQLLRVLSRAQDARGLWWVKGEIPYRNELRVLWCLYERFERSSLPLESIPLEP